MREKLIYKFLAAAIVFGIAAVFGCSGDKDAEDQVDDLPRLSAFGHVIVDSSGNPVSLRGVNLGGWLYHETWITGVGYPAYLRILEVAEDLGIVEEAKVALYDQPARDTLSAPNDPEENPLWWNNFQTRLLDMTTEDKVNQLVDQVSQFPSVRDDSDLPLRLLLEERFGVDGRDELLEIFQDSWMLEKDIAWLASQGFNLVRVPIGYRSLTIGNNATSVTELNFNKKTFGQIDRLLWWCKKHGVYAILDLQESPGGHNGYSGEATLYKDPKMQQLTIDLWLEISRRYRRESVVAAYSLLAEPMSAPSAAARDEMYDRLYQAIRESGDTHLMVIHDGFMGLESLPVPADYGWENVIYSTHLFEWGVNGLTGYQGLIAFYEQKFIPAQAEQNVPYYIGSFSTMIDEDWAYEALALLVKQFEIHNWSWSLWTYKFVADPIDIELWNYTTAWGLRGTLASEFDRPDLALDDFDVLADKFAAYADLKIDPNDKILEALRSYRNEFK